MEQKKYVWYPVYTSPRAEKKVLELLEAKGIQAYLPLQKRLKQWSDRKKWVAEPLLPSYLFVKVSQTEFAAVLGTKGVSRFIYFSGQPAHISEKQIEAMRLLLSNSADFEITDRKFEKGEEIIVTSGPLVGLRGELVKYLTYKKLLVRLGNTGKSLIVQMPIDFLEHSNAMLFAS